MLETRTAKHVCGQAERLKRERVDAETERSVLLQLIAALLKHAIHADDCGPVQCDCHVDKAIEVLQRNGL